MSTATYTTEELVNREYRYGFVTDIETDTVPRGLNEDIHRVPVYGDKPQSGS